MVADLLALTLEKAGLSYQSHGTLASISAAIRARRFDLLILDWSLPDGEADRVIRLARSLYGWDLPILIKSVNGEEHTIIGALELGADDYVPLRMWEVVARVKALLRRTRRDYPDNLEVGPFQIDEANQRILLSGEPLSLTAIEYCLACHFLNHLNGFLSRERVLTEVWDRTPVIDTRTVDTHVGRLRRRGRAVRLSPRRPGPASGPDPERADPRRVPAKGQPPVGGRAPGPAPPRPGRWPRTTGWFGGRKPGRAEPFAGPGCPGPGW